MLSLGGFQPADIGNLVLSSVLKAEKSRQALALKRWVQRTARFGGEG
jgi:hypothetical protein